MPTCQQCHKPLSSDPYVLGIFFANEKFDQEPGYCDANCANKWLTENFNDFIDSVNKVI